MDVERVVAGKALLERYTEEQMRCNAPLLLFTAADGTEIKARILTSPEDEDWCRNWAQPVVDAGRKVQRLQKRLEQAEKEAARAEARIDKCAESVRAALDSGTEQEAEEAKRKVALRETWFSEAQDRADEVLAELDKAHGAYQEAVRRALNLYCDATSEAALAEHGATYGQIHAAFEDLYSLTDPTRAGQLSRLRALLPMMKSATDAATAMKTTPTAPTSPDSGTAQSPST